MGNYIESIKFFSILYTNTEFCKELGKVILASGVLESNLRTFLKLKGISPKNKKATLGLLISTLKNNNLLSKNIDIELQELKFQRNYLTHSLYDLFSEKIEETVLHRNNLSELDVYAFTDKAQNLANNLYSLAQDVMEQIKNYGISSGHLI